MLTKMTNNKIMAALSVLLIVLLSLSGCKKEGGGGPGGPGAAQTTVFAVNTTTAVKGQIQDYISLSGDIVAGSTVDVYSDAAGKVAEVYVAIGQRVGRGDRIAAVDPSRPGMDFRWGIATAPISGTVVALTAQVGMTISQAVPLARISGGGAGGNAALEIRLYVAERFISKMAMNLPCEITLDAWPGEVFQGSISEIAPTVDPASRTMEVRVNVRNADSKLKAGMFAKVKIVTERKDNIVKIPAAALLNRFGEQYVFAIDHDPENPEQTIVKKRVIVPGILIDGVLEVQSGLAPDEEIVIRGQTLLDEGSHINIVERLAPLGEIQ
ncbi:MAG: efflux RND transporter periplasmic adaptor subunit [Treponema sp.]|nr:efflux RND transporter periplasmic adaptor subunit [Treponema sp.]